MQYLLALLIEVLTFFELRLKQPLVYLKSIELHLVLSHSTLISMLTRDHSQLLFKSPLHLVKHMMRRRHPLIFVK